ncbi:hypothetical protein SERLADRAFT_438006 [Serpula lacrymans var. lacrymans S7.9]|uniref:Uncharacterized protein n=1 Tax=Serpula lacrymans var. lacrymans (strain S7.9) TaxID=578457 RepID=F8NWP3_SERL9|nr:uncharacterized protein SERLADRAFT_438006 [Serpula lacrymans var. lacrymans S7.9]EGO24395.1 hypothetical protein SERLADRAFT_438006 [Serpula lacrymans var. lacrymans S7.9]
MAQTPTSLQLKDAGNTLYLKKDYIGAYAKYTEAIVVDGDNAVLYANRSACCLAIEKYLDAAEDAQKATSLNPYYPKAWARFASAQAALLRYQGSVISWERALDALPRQHLSAAELKQKHEFEEGLRSAKLCLAIVNERGAPEGSIKIHKPDQEKLPWRIAQRILPRMRRRNQEEASKSSAWVIAMAWEEFGEGVKLMRQLKTTPREGQQFLSEGTSGVLPLLTNGILRDRRVFHISGARWFDDYNKQLDFEVKVTKAWPTLSPQQVLYQAKRGLRQKGWDEVRPAISTTIRAWVMLGLLDSLVGRAHHVALEHFRKVIEVLELGRVYWKTVPKEQRGSIFDDAFIRGIHAYSKDPGLNSKFQLALLFQEADDLIKETRADHYLPEMPYDPGFLSSFYIYPIGAGLAAKGFYHAQMAEYVTTREEILDHSHKAAQFYLESANTYPQDDENHAWYLRCAVEYMWKCGTELRVTLVVLKRMREAIPKMKEIWGFVETGKMEELQMFVDAEEMLLKEVDRGKVTLGDLAAPVWAIDKKDIDILHPAYMIMSGTEKRTQKEKVFTPYASGSNWDSEGFLEGQF